MICASIGRHSFEEIVSILEDPAIEMAEIRLDLCDLATEEIEELFSESELPLVATCRLSGGLDERQVQEKLDAAIRSGAAFADLELEAPANLSRHIQKQCREYGTELIRSYHNDGNTPDTEYLLQVLDRCRRYGASISKIVTRAQSAEDVTRVAALYGSCSEGHLLAFCSGEEGRQSRLDCLAEGAPFTYACLSEDERTAQGQWTVTEMRERLYGGRYVYSNSSLSMPSSKSFAQRAIIAAALAEGSSHLENFSPCGDSMSAIEVARAMGAQVSLDGSTLTVKGIGPSCGPLGLERLDTSESGLLTRLMIPLLSCINGRSVVVEGRGTLLERPLEGASDIMAAFGVMVGNEDASRGKTVFVPVKVRGKLVPGVADISGRGGSQLISGLLMSLPLCSRPTTLYVADPKSIPYMFITVDLLKRFGIVIESEMEGNARMIEEQDWSDCTGITFKIKGGQKYKASGFALESDWSAAASYLVAGAVFGKAEIDNLDTSSLQADISIMDILVEAGASVSQTEDGRVCVRKGPLEAFEADLNNAPDLFPVVSVLAAFCAGTSCIKGTGRLRTKESDRCESILNMLSLFGVNARIEEDAMFVEGHSLSSRILSDNLIRGGDFSSRHDHRMVMAMKVAALGASEEIRIDDQECVSKSFPGFNI